jgi:hypothetical protein
MPLVKLAPLVSSSGDTAQVRVAGQIRVSILAISQTQQVDETWSMLREGGKWKWCGLAGASAIPQQLLKCEPDVLASMQQALARVTSARMQMKSVYGRSILNGTVEELVDSKGNIIHSTMLGTGSDGKPVASETISTGNKSWEKKSDGTWTSPASSSSNASWSTIGWLKGNNANIRVGFKTSSTQYANQPTDVYQITTNTGAGTLYLNSQNCLPVRLIMLRGQSASGNYDEMTFEWNVPLKITPPTP